MKAARFHGRKDIRIDSIDPPVPKDGQVVISIDWCGICGTDLHEYLIGPAVIPTEPHHVTGETLPVVMGHEFCGRITHAPPGCRLKVGQAVMVDPAFRCKSCYACETGHGNLCMLFGFLGLSGGGGGYSEAIAVDPEICHVLPESVKLSDAALIEPLVVGRRAIRSSGFDRYEDKEILVIGGGPIGQALLHNLRAVGVKKVYLSEPADTRQMQISELADKVFDPRKVKIGDECRSLTDGRGVDIVFDCAGIAAGLRDAMDAVKIAGTVVNVAGWEKECVVPIELFMLKGIIYRPSMSYTHEDFQDVVEEFSRGMFPGAERMITNRIALEDIVEKGFEELINNKDQHTKILVTPKKELLASI